MTASSTPGRAAWRAAGATHPGHQRDGNEDRFLVDAARGVCVVVDGVGGHAGGERAAAVALEMLSARLARETGSPAERLREGIALANNAILDAAAGAPGLAGMTCVLTAVVLDGHQLTAGHVGDTRLYKLRGGEIRKLTHDHSPVGEREDAGDLSELEAMRHPRRNEVYRDVGAAPRAPEDDDFVEIVVAPFEPDAALLLCSDGLSDQVSSASLRRIVHAHAGEPERAVAELIQAANDAGGKDNVTAIVVEGERFAAAARTLGAHTIPGAGRTPMADPAASRAGAPVAAPTGSRGRPLAAFLGGLLAGVLLAAALGWTWRTQVAEWLAPPAGPSGTPSLSRQWRVGLAPDADASSIGDALAKAAPGDTVVLSAGEYREAVVVRQPILLVGPREAVIRPPLGAGDGWTAVTVSDVEDAQLTGFTIAAAEGQPLGTGIRVERARVRIAGVAVSGASAAAIEIGAGAAAAVTASVLHDNGGAGVVARGGARLRLDHTGVLRNGTAAGRPRAGIELEPPLAAALFANAIADNGGGALAGWPAADLPALLRDNVLRPSPEPARRRSPATAPPARPTRSRE